MKTLCPTSLGRIVTAGLFGGCALLLWSAFSWSALPWLGESERPIDNQDEVLRVLTNRLSSSGVYRFPSIPKRNPSDGTLEEDRAAYNARRRIGPYGLIIYIAHGKDFIGPLYRAFALDLIAATFAAFLISTTFFLRRYCQRVLFVFALGVFAALVSWLTLWNWDSFPSSYFMTRAGDAIVSWLLAGLVMARIIPSSPRSDDQLQNTIETIAPPLRKSRQGNRQWNQSRIS